MIKFFRKTRQRLLTENKFSKYLIYAIGEIILVVIGILIALSINNWNEEKKLRKLERTYLLGILDDLKTDTTKINTVVIPYFLDNHKVNHKYLDSLDTHNLLTNESLVEKVVAPYSMSNSGLSFHPTYGTYNEIISQGNSGLIKDKELFNAIQELYEVGYKRNNEHSTRRDKLTDNIRLKYAYEFKYLTKMQQVQNKQLLADLFLLLQTKRQYVRLVRRIENEIVAIIKKLENQLTNND